MSQSVMVRAGYGVSPWSCLVRSRLWGRHLILAVELCRLAAFGGGDDVVDVAVLSGHVTTGRVLTVPVTDFDRPPQPAGEATLRGGGNDGQRPVEQHRLHLGDTEVAGRADRGRALGRCPSRTTGGTLSSPNRTVNSGLGRCASAGVEAERVAISTSAAANRSERVRVTPAAWSARYCSRSNRFELAHDDGPVDAVQRAVETHRAVQRRRGVEPGDSRSAGGGVLSPVAVSASCIQYSTAFTA